MKHFIVYFGIEKDRDGKQIPHEERATSLLALRALACKYFGGYTCTSTAGGWVNDGKVVEEGSLKFDLYGESFADVFKFAEEGGKLLRQSCVLLDAYGQAQLVDTN